MESFPVTSSLLASEIVYINLKLMSNWLDWPRQGAVARSFQLGHMVYLERGLRVPVTQDQQPIEAFLYQTYSA